MALDYPYLRVFGSAKTKIAFALCAIVFLGVIHAARFTRRALPPSEFPHVPTR